MLRFREYLAGKVFHQAVSGFERDIQEDRHWELTDVVHRPVTMGWQIAEGLGILPDRPPWIRLYPWLLEHLHERILVERMAEQVNMSPRNFARVFRCEFHVPPGEFLDRVRLASAKSDLESGMQSIEQIAIARGFGDSSTMRRAFMRVLGVTPSRYRRVGVSATANVDPGSALRDSPAPKDVTLDTA